jgi:hypothetical protein
MDKFNFDFLYCELKYYGNFSIYENGEYVGIYEGLNGKKCLPYEGVIEGEVIRTLEDSPVIIKIYENNFIREILIIYPYSVQLVQILYCILSWVTD